MQVFSKADIDRILDWQSLVEAMRAGHRGPRPQIGDRLMREGEDSLLVRIAWMGGALGLKAVTIFPENARTDPPVPSIQGQFLLFDGERGHVEAVMDGIALTAWKTAADSALGCDLLARAEARTLLMVGAGTQARSLVRAHLSVRPGIERVLLWNRSRTGAERLASELSEIGREVTVTEALEAAVGEADIVSSATMAASPIIRGAWLKPGTHVDLVGAFRPDMREADDETLLRGRLFVDARETTVHEIGEILIPLREKVIGEENVLGDLFDLVAGSPGRLTETDITVFKNGGGAHLDLMTARLVADKAARSREDSRGR
ncbi:MAG: ornithine cyclodeaminase [Alphaproteobacteria bacterium]|nr:MAG: ornithine cyclodeaminase [Alphaproteobacteria bacterium]